MCKLRENLKLGGKKSQIINLKSTFIMIMHQVKTCPEVSTQHEISTQDKISIYYRKLKIV